MEVSGSSPLSPTPENQPSQRLDPGPPRVRVETPVGFSQAPFHTTNGCGQTSAVIRVRDLRKTYVFPEREAGLRASVRGLFRRRSREVAAVDTISFDIAAGEVVGFLGPNGAGKTTTLKMLSGLLYPTCGEATVLGHVPWRREKSYLRRITLVMGQRNQLIWDIPAADSFELNRAVYRIPMVSYPGDP